MDQDRLVAIRRQLLQHTNPKPNPKRSQASLKLTLNPNPNF